MKLHLERQLAVAAEISRKNNPNRATTKPKPISAMPIRTHAHNVLSAARPVRASREKLSGLSFAGRGILIELRQGV